MGRTGTSERLAGAGGAVAAGVIAHVRHVRPRPLHPSGVVLPGVLTLDDGDAPGTADLGGPGPRDVRVRVSRAAGLPRWLPDNQGLAVTWEADGRRHDLPLAGSGLGRIGRFLLVPRRRAVVAPLSTLVTFVDGGGRALLLAAVPVGPRRQVRERPEPSDGGGVRLRLLAARPWGSWQPIGRLECPPSDPDAALPDDPDLRFDPVLRVPGTLTVPGWAARVRRPVYRRARG